MKKRTWLWVVLGVFGAMVFVVLVLVGGAIFEFRRHVKNEFVGSTVAEQEFSRTRERFRGQQPLVEFVGRENFDNDDRATVHRPAADAPRVQIHAIRVLIYDENRGRLIRADVPAWLLRMMPNGRVGGFQGDDEFVRRRITLEDIERHGYGLVLDGHNRNTQILVWSE